MKKLRKITSNYLLSLIKKANTDKDAAFKLGMLYMDGIKIPQNTLRAIFYFQQATKLGHSNSQALCGYLYKNGATDLKPDLLKAAEFFEDAALKSGDELLFWEAINLWLFGADGKTPLDGQRGIRLLAYMNYIMENPYSMFLRGEACRKGLWGEPKNIDEAKMWYRYAANLGYQPALSILRTLSAN